MQFSNDLLDKLLLRFKPRLANDYEKYRNHVYRVFLNCTTLDTESANEEKYAIAAVFHDIGIWTNNTFDYLDPSIAELKEYLYEINKNEWLSEISSMIYWHHKVKAYVGEYSATVEVFRKADWVDVSLGLLKFGIESKKISAIKRSFPNAGFHFFLLKQTGKYWIKHPLNPIPVLKR